MGVISIPAAIAGAKTIALASRTNRQNAFPAGFHRLLMLIYFLRAVYRRCPRESILIVTGTGSSGSQPAILVGGVVAGGVPA
jgi:hypothetical protein